MKDICPVCGDLEMMTDDHIVPQWLVRRILHFGLDWSKKTDIEHAPVNYLRKFKRRICQKCNNKKGGKIDWTDSIVRNFMHTFATKILEKLNETST